MAALSRAGGVVKFKGIAMRLGASLPEELWPEIWRAAVYIYNRSPRRYRHPQDSEPTWMSPIQRLNSYLRTTGHPVEGPDQPDVAHLRAYGCRAYPLTAQVKAGTERRNKLDPRAHIGYLVGYEGVAIYRVWVPELSEVVITRDVTFNEGQFYSPGNERPAIPIRQLEDLTARLAIEPIGQEPDEDTRPTIHVGGWNLNLTTKASQTTPTASQTMATASQTTAKASQNLDPTAKASQMTKISDPRST